MRHQSRSRVLTPSNRPHLAALLAAATATLAATPLLHAASQTWSPSPTDANFATLANWVGNAPPGSLNGGTNNSTSADIATFNSPLPASGIGTSANPIAVDLNRLIRGITFDANAGPYFIGVPNGNVLTLSNGGAISMTAAVTAAQVISGPVRSRVASSTNGAYSYINDSTTTAATLSFTNPTASFTNANGRPTTITLAGANTGDNLISSDITDAAGTQNVSFIIKTGAGRWILSGNNTFTGSSNTGIQINQGTLSAQSANALGQSSTATANNVSINNTGTLELANNITLNGALILNLNNGGTITSVGSTSLPSTLKISTAAATTATIATTNAADVLTLGDAANDLTGGASDTTLNVAGPGTLLLTQASNYVGSWSFNAGNTVLGSPTSLGSSAAGVTFGAASSAKLQLNSQSVTLAKLTSAGPTGTLENGGASPATLTLNTTTANTFAATLQDGAAGGSLALTKSGVGSLTLSNANTFTGPTTVNGGTLLATNTAGSATGSGPVTVNNLATLGGTGTLAGAVTLNAGATLSPGLAGIGTLTLASLNLQPGSSLAYDISSTSSLDKTVVTTPGSLNIDGGALLINGGTTPFTTNGVYNLISYAGSISGAGATSLTVDPASKNTATNSYLFGTAAGYVTLTISNSGGSIAYWNTDASGSWSAGPWSPPGAPNAPGAFASFGGGGTAITANRTITVDGPFTVGTLAFNNPNFSYTLANAAGALITLDNAGSGAFVTDSAGSHTVQAPLAMTAQGASVTVVNAADTLTLAGDVAGPSATLTKSGPGTLVLTGNNSYTGGTNLKAGVLRVNSPASLGDPAATLTFNGGSLQLLADVSTARPYQVNALADALIDTNSFNLTHTGTISPTPGSSGGLVKNGAGLLALNGANSYAGPTTLNAGALSINSNASLGDPATGAPLNLGANTTLLATATAALNNGAAGTADRAVNINPAGATIDVADATTLTISGPVTGGALTKTDAGTLALSNTANTSPLVVSAGTLTAASNASNTNGGLGSGPITLQGNATINSNFGNSNTLNFSSPLTLPAAQTGNIFTPQRFLWQGAVAGAGTLNVTVTTPSTSNRMDFSNNFAAFTGTLNLLGTPTGSARILLNGGGFNAAGWANTTLDLEGTVTLNAHTNSTGNTVSVGALSSAFTTAGLNGGDAGTITYSVGSLGTSTTFAGLISANTAITKVGAGTLTLTNVNTYTGPTTVSAGTLQFGADNPLSNASVVAVNTGGTLDINGHTAAISSLTGTTGTVTLNGGSLSLNNGQANATFAGSVTGTGTLTYASSVNQSIGNVDVTTLSDNGGKIILTSPALASRITNLNVPTTTLELDSKLVLPTMSLADATTLVISGYNGGSWNGYGIATNPDGLHGIAITTVSTLGAASLPNLTGLTGNETLLVGTFYGDLNLDNRVNADDYARMDRGYAKHLTGWINGDLNYDNIIDSADYLLLDTAYASTGVTHEAFTTLLAQRQSQFGDAYVTALIAATPEPTSLAACGLAATTLLTRRRRV